MSAFEKIWDIMKGKFVNEPFFFVGDNNPETKPIYSRYYTEDRGDIKEKERSDYYYDKSMHPLIASILRRNPTYKKQTRRGDVVPSWAIKTGKMRNYMPGYREAETEQVNVKNDFQGD